MRKFIYAVIVGLGISLSGCGGNYAVHPDKPGIEAVAKDPVVAQQYIDEMNARIASVALTVGQDYKDGLISWETKEKYRKWAQDAADYMDKAESYKNVGDLVNTKSQVELAEKLLTLVQKEIAEYQSKVQ